MNEKSLMSSILMSLGLATAGDSHGFTGSLPAKQKGQKRNTASKSSGAAQLKRNAKTRNNINKRKGK